MKILVLPGDGIGPEISAATLSVLDRANALYQLGLEWQHDEIGFTTLKKEGTTLPPRVLLAKRLGFDLADPFAGDAELLPNFLQRVVGVHADAETHPQHAFFAGG